MTSVEHETKEASFRDVIRIDESQVQSHVDQMVRATVEETLNSLLSAEADELCGARRYERSPERLDTRAGHYERKLLTKAGEVKLKVPRLRSLPFETQIIERYRRRESSVEEALVEMYLAGVSVRRVEDITEALWGARVSASTVSELNQKIYAQIESWRNRPIEGEHAYVFLDGIWLKRCWGGEVKNVAVLVAIGVGKAQAVAEKLRAMQLAAAAEIVGQGAAETLSYMAFPREHWRSLRTNNMLERIMREIRRRTRVVGAFPDGHSALMLVSARLRHIAGTRWGSRCYLDMERLREPIEQETLIATA